MKTKKTAKKDAVKAAKIALAIIVKPGEHEILNRALQNASTEVDGIFVTITGKDKKIEEVCGMFKNMHVSHYQWDFNFANARNFNFGQVTKDYDYILWMDADDCFRDIENLRQDIEENRDADAFLMNYLYYFDQWKNPIIVHMKTMIVKNDNCVKWVGALHEDFAPSRQLNIKLIKNIDRMHLSTDARVESAKVRNLEISENELKRLPDDPRSYWNVANCQRSLGLNNEALKTFDTFIKMSKSDEEKYLAMLRMVDIFLSKRDFRSAIETVRYAIGTRPEYPDAYFSLGNVYAEMQNFVLARDNYLLGLEKKVPKYTILVYNPREYDFVPLKNLARCYIELMMPSLAYKCLQSCLEICPKDEQIILLLDVMAKEKRKFNKVVKKVAELQKIKDIKVLKEELDKLPNDVRSHPAVCNLRNLNFIKTESSGRDIAYYCGNTFEMWNPEISKTRGIGGSEEAVMNLAREWAKKGYNVEVYNNCGWEPTVHDGVIYKPFWMFNYRDKQDILISWRSLKLLDHEVNAGKIYVDLHDVMEPGELNEIRVLKADKIMVKSKAHRDLFPLVPDEKFLIIPNGVDLTLFDMEVKRDPYYLVNFSSPDRSLNALLDIYKEVLLRVDEKIRKKIKLGWFYGWKLFESLRTEADQQAWKDMVQKKFKEMGKMVIGGDRISHEQVAIENLKAGAILYPSQFYEIDWIGGSKAQIAGAIPITSNYAAIGEKVKKYGIKIDVSDLPKVKGFDFGIMDPEKKEMFINAVVDYLQNVHKYDKDRLEMSNWAKEQFNLERIANIWIEEFNNINV